MSSTRYPIVIDYEYPTTELFPLYSSKPIQKNPKSKRIGYSICCGISCYLCITLCITLLLLLLLLIWFIFGFIAYDLMFFTQSECELWGGGNLPTKFFYHGPCDAVYPLVPQSTLQRFFVSNENDWKEVYFSSRQTDDNILWSADKHIAAYEFLQKTTHPFNYQSLPWIINVHGRFACKNATLLLSGMTYHSGYNVLTLDLRNCGQSSDTIGKYMTFGSEEHFDVLGAFDYIQQHYPTHGGIGLIGNSMGGGTALIAFAREKRFKAAFIDSGVCSVYETLSSNVKRMLGISDASFVMSSLCLAAPTKPGGLQLKCPPFRYDPANLASQIDRPIFFHHSIEDELVPISNPKLCAKIIKETNPSTPVVEVYHNFPYVSTCGGGHSQLQWSELDDYYFRLDSFFRQYLPIVQ